MIRKAQIRNTKLFSLIAVLLLSFMLAFTLGAAPRVYVEKDGTYTSKEAAPANEERPPVLRVRH